MQRFILVMLVAAVVAVAARRLRLPYTVGLLCSGTALAWVFHLRGVAFTKELIFLSLLPPLVFEAAYHLAWKRVWENFVVVVVLATVGVGISVAVTTAGVHYLAAWAWTPALLLGVILSPTDPVSVVATFKELGVGGRLQLLVDAESLFNDGTAAALFGIVVAAVASPMPGILTAGGELLVVVAGGIASGLAVGLAMLLLAGQTRDHLVQITATTIAAYASFLAAEHFHCSGVLASLTAGLLMGNSRFMGGLPERNREAIESFWEYAAFVANSVIFLLMGVRLANQGFAPGTGLAALVIVLALAARAAGVYSCCACFRSPATRVPAAHQHVLVWGGLRGALALALALGLPAETPRREEIVMLCFAVVGFSVVVQGLTMPPLLRRLGVLESVPKIAGTAP